MKTKRTFKKIASTATAAILASCTMMPLSVANVSAAGGTITITSTHSGHTYEAYQIFDGDLSTNSSGNYVLSNIDWGNGITDGSATLTAIKSISAFSSCNTVADVADILATLSANSTDFKSFVDVIDGYLNTTNANTSGTYSDGKYVINTTDVGYFLVKDKDDSIDNTSHEAYTNYIIEVLGTGTVDIETKNGLPTFDKKVYDVNDSTGNPAAGFGVSADHDYNDKVKFQLTGTLPDNYDTYPTYKYVMNDTLSSNLTFDKNSVVVKVNGTTISDGYTVSDVDSNNNFTVTFENLKNKIATYSDSVSVVVEYEATLKDTADIGMNGENNTGWLTYSNNPYNSSDMGKTPDVTVEVYTYEVIINKVDDNDTALTGANFTLYKYNSSSSATDKFDTVVGTYTATDKSTFNFKGIDDGRYKLVEDAPPTGYNKLKDPIYFEVTATHNDTSITGLTATLTDENGSTKSGDYTFTVDKSAGTITTKIENKAGSTLPSTGGIGTTPFFVGGGAIALGAGVYIIVKKRMNNK